MRIPPLILCLLVTGHIAHAAVRFVAPTGSDTSAGTEAQPWKTLRKAAATVQPGDTVRIKAGEYFEGPTWTLRQAGTAEQPITFQAAGDGAVRITGSTLVPSGAWTHVKGAIHSTPITQRVLAVFCGDLPLHDPGDRAKIFAVDDLIPNSFVIANGALHVWLEDGSDPNQSAMRIARDHVVSLRDCHHTLFDGLTVEFGFNGFKDQGNATHHITIRNCIIRSITSQGIQPVAKDSVIERNVFQKIGSNKYQHGIYGSQAGTIIRGNVFEEISGAGIHQYNQDHPAGGGCEFSGNIFRKPRKMTVRSGSTYYTDIIAWGEGGHRIFNNVFFGEGKRSGISLNSFNNRVSHNTFVGSTVAIGFHPGKTGNHVNNNLVQDATRAFVSWPRDAQPQTLDHNLYHNTTAAPRWEHDGMAHRAFTAYQQAAGETHSHYEAPGMTSATDAHLLPGSPAIDAGAKFADIATDFDGVVRPQGTAPDIGAYEVKR